MSSKVRSNSAEGNNRGGNGGAFLTQRGEKFQEVKKEISELEQLLAGVNQAIKYYMLLTLEYTNILCI